MLEQYWRIKSLHRDKIVFFHLGDFYEMFYEDAQVASRILDIALTHRTNKHEKIPMCGVPYESAEPYIRRLTEQGYKVVLCDQVEPPQPGKTLVRREVVRVITPGTMLESALSDRQESNVLAALFWEGGEWSLGSINIATGECLVTHANGADARRQIYAELMRFEPAECVFPSDRQNPFAENPVIRTWTPHRQGDFDPLTARERVASRFGQAVAGALEAESSSSLPLQVLGGLLGYLEATQQGELRHLQAPRIYQLTDALRMDPSARTSLGLFRRRGEGMPGESLMDILDLTRTAMGSRKLRAWLERPLVDPDRIRKRLDLVEAFIRNGAVRSWIRNILKDVYDLERLAARVGMGTANPRELAALRTSLERLPEIRDALQESSDPMLRGRMGNIDVLDDLYDLLRRSLVEDPPTTLMEGGLIRTGYDQEIDALRNAEREGKTWLVELERRERERTGIKSLRVGFNKVFGYYLEVTHANRHLVPEEYERKQTLRNAERYVTPDLKETESRLLGARERLLQREYERFLEIRRSVAEQLPRLQKTAAEIASLDVYAALAEAAVRYGYVRPHIVDGEDLRLRIRAGRHPIVERIQGVRFVPNDIHLDENQPVVIVTGPNMGGKSTYLRQVALITIMAQAGSFVPAEEAEIAIVDRIFTRIGAADDLARGRSTFMLEIQEALQVLLSGSRKSLALIDELGRGTGTYDGIAFSTAYLEYLYRHIRCRTLVSTHFFELTQLADRLEGVRNVHVGATHEGERLIFSYRVEEGAADRSYGVEVARAAGMPTELVLRARELLTAWEQTKGDVRMKGAATEFEANAGDSEKAFFPKGSLDGSRLRTLLEVLAETDVLHLTPLQAMERLQGLSEQARELLAWYDDPQKRMGRTRRDGNARFVDDHDGPQGNHVQTVE